MEEEYKKNKEHRDKLMEHLVSQIVPALLQIEIF
jgi:hypothetical protein